MQRSEIFTGLSILNPVYALLECRLSIIKVKGKPVFTKYARVKINGLTMRTIEFSSSLQIPTDIEITFLLEFIGPIHVVRLTGTGLGLINSNETLFSYQYRLHYESNSEDQMALFHMAKRLVHITDFPFNRALEAYDCSNFWKETYSVINVRSK